METRKYTKLYIKNDPKTNIIFIPQNFVKLIFKILFLVKNKRVQHQVFYLQKPIIHEKIHNPKSAKKPQNHEK